MKLDSNNHSVFLMCYHLVLVVKYRRNVIDDTISDFGKDKFVSLGDKYNITLERKKPFYTKTDRQERFCIFTFVSQFVFANI